MERPLVIGRYTIHGKIASGGMGTVHLGRARGLAGFSRTVAIKRLHPHHTENPDFVAMFLDEARLAARVRHPNVVQTLDVVAAAGEVFLVLEYVNGATLGQLQRQLVAVGGGGVPPSILVSIVAGMLHGLHAAHEATDEAGTPLSIVHRDVSPQNVIVGVDGVARVLDFGVAKAVGRIQKTRDGQLKGKLAYMAPEQVLGKALTRRCDIYSTAVVLWESLTRRRLFRGDNEGAVLEQKLWGKVELPSQHASDISPELEAVIMRGLARDPNERFATAHDMAAALEAAMAPSSESAVGTWVRATVADMVAKQAADVAEIESAPETSDVDAVVSVRTISVGERDAVAQHVISVTAQARAIREERESNRSLDAAAGIAHGSNEESNVTIFAKSAEPKVLPSAPEAPLAPRRRYREIALALGGIAVALAVGSRVIGSSAQRAPAAPASVVDLPVVPPAPSIAPPPVASAPPLPVAPSPASPAPPPSATSAAPVVQPAGSVPRPASHAAPALRGRPAQAPAPSAAPASPPAPASSPTYNPRDHL